MVPLKIKTELPTATHHRQALISLYTLFNPVQLSFNLIPIQLLALLTSPWSLKKEKGLGWEGKAIITIIINSWDLCGYMKQKT